MNNKVQQLVQLLDDAFHNHQSISPLTNHAEDLTIDEAYAVQLERVNVAIQAGEVISGKKIGLTSVAMQNLLGVDQPDYGHLFHSMEVKDGEDVSLKTLFQPKVEGEITFVLKKDLVSPNVTAEDVLLATDYVVAAIEIVDSRVKDWKIKLEDTVADNASCGLYVLSEKAVPLNGVDLKKVQMKLLKNGEVINEGCGLNVLGDPAICVAWLANKLSEYNVTLKAGEVILSGALSAAVEAEPGDQFTAVFTELGSVSVNFTE
ncbi:2-keto-4-pentenoate hydratase [Alkalihalobacillus sp. BA299]|uniref:2-keto-4-pentenoate hydratase n=1 Tax=Alkalihalobacillus sp. BA299 TaxID=2815938 RepID=UPI001ADC25E0|nr:fumarylacetoacetate hydrolase family protein [Alkalihalobacillus sp. BA299]